MTNFRENLRARWAVYSLIFASVAIALGKLYLTWSHAHYFVTSADGGYYYDLVENLVAGRGFVTNISPFHHALPSFPYPSIVYPLWPLAAAGVARLFGTTFACFYLPTLFYFVAVWLAFVTGRRYYPHILIERGGVRFHAGHLLAIGLASNRGFYLFTSRPYTEGFSYCLLFLVLYLAFDYFRRPRLVNTLLLGLTMAAAALARSQMLLIFLAMVCTSLLLFCSAPRKNWSYLLGVLVVTGEMCLCFIPYLRWLAQPALKAGFRHYVSFSSYSHQPGLLPAVENSVVHSASEWFSLYGKGLLVAFTPWDHYGYFDNFTCYMLPLPLLLLWGVGRVFRNPFGCFSSLRLHAKKLVGEVRSNAIGAEIFVLCFATGSLLSIHLTHLDSPEHEWLFWSRHSIPVLFAFAICLGVFLRASGPARVVGRLLFLAVLISGAVQLGDTTQRIAGRNALWKHERKGTIDWINAHSGPHNVPVVVTHLPYGKMLRPHTPHAAYRALDFKDTPDVIQVMFDRLHSDYLILRTENGEFTGQAAETLPRFATPSHVPGFRRIAVLEDAVVFVRNSSQSLR